MDNRNSMASIVAWENLHPMVEFAREVFLKKRPEVLNDEERRLELEGALERYRAREIARGKPFSHRDLYAALRSGEHLQLRHQRD